MNGTLSVVRVGKTELVKKHKAHLKALGEDENAARAVKQPILTEAYQASKESIRKLEIIPLSNLRQDDHHRGQGIVVKTIISPFRGAATVTVVEDDQGNADRVAIYNQSDTSILSNIPEGCVIAVKEPYYKHMGDNDFMISIDHPSDVVLLRFNDPIIPLKLRAGAEQAMTKPAEEWRSAGDAAFIQRDFPTAVFCYTEALEEADEGSMTLKTSTLAKRAGTNLMLGRYDAAKDDALASCSGISTDWRAYFTAAKAAYGLCQYRDSRAFFESALKYNASAPNVQKEHQRCLARVHEEIAGEYDFPTMYSSLTPKHVHLDNATFTSNTIIADSPFHGRGVFAARPIRAGELVFVEKATIMPNQYEPDRASASLYAMMIRLMTDNPSVLSSVLPLYAGDYQRNASEGAIVDGVPVVDVYLLESIRLKNCFSAPLNTLDATKHDGPIDRMSKGLWRFASYLNHSCVPNTMRSFMGDMLISRAVRDISAGEEILQQYVPIRANTTARQEEFLLNWGFECQCDLCAAEAKSSPAMHSKRMAVLEQVEKWAVKKPPQNFAPEAAIRHMDRLARQLEDLHEPEIFATLPRLALVYPTMWLIRAHRGRKNHTKVVSYAMKVLRNFGFFMPSSESGSVGRVRDVFTQRSQDAVSLMTIHVVTVLKFAADAYRELGQQELGDQFEEAAEFGYKIITGFENNLDEIAAIKSGE